MKAFAAEDEELYPSGDGQPMAESAAQRQAIYYVVGALDRFFGEREDVCVGGDLLMYYVEGTRACVAPDAFVAFGVPRGLRDRYLLWREGKAPDFVMEVASTSTWEHDRDEKPGIYAGMGVSEYWRYDPKGTFFRPRLQGVRRAGGGWRPVEARLEGGLKLFRSEALGLDLRLDDDGRIRLCADGKDLPSDTELQARTEDQQATIEELRAREEEQQATIEDQQATIEDQQARIEDQQARAEDQQARIEEQQAENLELRERIKALSGQVPPQVP